MGRAKSAKSNPTPLLPLDTALKVAPLVGGVLYAALFLGYREFYSHFSIQPEEVGVTYLFVLVRSVGFLALAAAVTGVLIVTWSLGDLSGSGEMRATPLRRGVAFAVQAMLGLVLALLAPPDWPPVVLVVASIAIVLTSLLLLEVSQRRRDGKRTALAAVLLIYSLIVPCVMVIGWGDYMGRTARAGVPVQPFTVLSIPILDIDASPVEAMWIGPVQQRPAGLFDDRSGVAEGLYLGENTKVLIMVLTREGEAPRIVRLPIPSIVSTFIPS